MLLIDLIQCENPKDIIADFLNFSCKELGIQTLPRITFISKPISNSESNSFAAYSPNMKQVQLYIKNRHILDILRSLCHELVHYRQDLNDQLKPDSGKTGSEEENEANSVAGQVMRKYGKLHPELF
jgi:hypothetical protein